MTSTFLKSADTPWFALDGDLSVFEVIAVVGALVWGGALVWMATSDVRKYRDHHGHHHTKPRPAARRDDE